MGELLGRGSGIGQPLQASPYTAPRQGFRNRPTLTGWPLYCSWAECRNRATFLLLLILLCRFVAGCRNRATCVLLLILLCLLVAGCRNRATCKLLLILLSWLVASKQEVLVHKCCCILSERALNVSVVSFRIEVQGTASILRWGAAQRVTGGWKEYPSLA